MKQLFILLLLSFTLTACSEKKTNDALESYRYWTGTRYWAGTNPPSDLNLIEGKYWQSYHWTKEYIVYLKFTATKTWWDDVMELNNFSEDNGEWTIPNDAPVWFKPSEDSIRYRSNLSRNSRYFRDELTGICYIYEIQL